MENASKALVMAGGILIAIMVIATLIYASSIWGIIPQKQQELDEVKNQTAFNQQYESYDRDSLYGTDLVSVLNKAIDNNEKYGVTSNFESMYINIEFDLLTPVEESETTYRRYYGGEKDGQIEQIKDSEYRIVLQKGTYSLSRNSKDIKNFIKEVETKTTQGKYGMNKGQKYQEYTQIVAGGSEFKSRIFKCSDVKYDSEGRINYMFFEEVDTSNLK